MINLKFFNPAIDHVSLMQSYDYEYLAKIQEVFGVTDFWAMYSWGFAPHVEAEDHAFLISKVEYFKRLGIRLHAYVQGPNVVYRDFPDKDWYCKDERGRDVTYHRGRKVVCVNAPEYRDFSRERIRAMYDKGFDGVYMDNLFMGQIGFSKKNQPILFSGCACHHCNKRFRSLTGEDISVEFTDPTLLSTYRRFRADSLSDFAKETAALAHAGGMLFGSNSFDPRFDSETVFGIDLATRARFEDYLLFENHAAPRKDATHGNEHAHTWARKKPVFVVSYNKGIGKDTAYSQRNIDQLFTEAVQQGFFPCIKGSEFVTGGIWHNLDPHSFTRPRSDVPLREKTMPKKGVSSRLLTNRASKTLLRRYYNPLFRLYMENKLARKILDPIYFRTIR
jgi:hypothetical protein